MTRLNTFMSGHLYHTMSSIFLLITHPKIRRWPGFLWHYTELPSAKSLISAQNHRYFYSSNKAGTTVYNARHCNEQHRKSDYTELKASSWQRQFLNSLLKITLLHMNMLGAAILKYLKFFPFKS